MKNRENNFESLRQLLKLKQHEVPPPGYFNSFSDQVIARLQSGEGRGAETTAERLNVQAPWLAWLMQIFEAKPGVLGGFATSLVLLLVIGVIASERSDSMPNNILTATTSEMQPTASLASVTAPSLLAPDPSSGIVASTNPVTSLQPMTTLFGQPSGSRLFQSASFAPGGN
jgi:hypothetical protein